MTGWVKAAWTTEVVTVTMSQKAVRAAMAARVVQARAAAVCRREKAHFQLIAPQQLPHRMLQHSLPGLFSRHCNNNRVENADRGNVGDCGGCQVVST